MLLDRHPLAC